MKLETVGDVMATRKLQVLAEPEHEVLVKLGRPQPSPDGPQSGEYFCRFQITGVGDERVRYAAGVDAFQAIELAAVDWRLLAPTEWPSWRQSPLGV